MEPELPKNAFQVGAKSRNRNSMFGSLISVQDCRDGYSREATVPLYLGNAAWTLNYPEHAHKAREDLQNIAWDLWKQPHQDSSRIIPGPVR